MPEAAPAPGKINPDSARLYGLATRRGWSPI
jgi:hypothetical protein